MRRVARLLVVGVLATLVCVALAAPAGAKRPKLRLSSPAFEQDGEIPTGFTCSGENASPPLRWRGTPPKAKDLALIMLDPDASIGTITHWLAWGIDPEAGELPEETLPPNVVQGANQRGTADYIGPCPPPGDEAHHYKFMLYALSKPLVLPSGSTLDQLRAAMRGKVIAKARLVGLYARPTQA